MIQWQWDADVSPTAADIGCSGHWEIIYLLSGMLDSVKKTRDDNAFVSSSHRGGEMT